MTFKPVFHPFKWSSEVHWVYFKWRVPFRRRQKCYSWNVDKGWITKFVFNFGGGISYMFHIFQCWIKGTDNLGGVGGRGNNWFCDDFLHLAKAYHFDLVWIYLWNSTFTFEPVLNEKWGKYQLFIYPIICCFLQGIELDFISQTCLKFGFSMVELWPVECGLK